MLFITDIQVCFSILNDAGFLTFYMRSRPVKLSPQFNLDCSDCRCWLPCSIDQLVLGMKQSPECPRGWLLCSCSKLLTVTSVWEWGNHRTMKSSVSYQLFPQLLFVPTSEAQAMCSRNLLLCMCFQYRIIWPPVNFHSSCCSMPHTKEMPKVKGH